VRVCATRMEGWTAEWHQQMMVHHVKLVQQQLVVRRQALHVQLCLVRQERIAPGLPRETGSVALGPGNLPCAAQLCSPRVFSPRGASPRCRAGGAVVRPVGDRAAERRSVLGAVGCGSCAPLLLRSAFLRGTLR
jgi:hypothetical protein